MSSPEAVPPSTARSAAEQSLRLPSADQIRRGGLEPGAFLDLNDLTRAFGVSRTPLREALLQLEPRGSSPSCLDGASGSRP